MPVSIAIEPLTPSIDMYDSPDTSSAYSLSGHITITASPSSSILGISRSSHNLLLSSLELTFEGQSELVLTDSYAPLRIITITKQLVSPSHPVQVTTDEDHAEWCVVFNLTVPGWLPATTTFADVHERNEAGVSYALHARAHFHSAGGEAEAEDAAAATASTSSVWNNLCTVMRLGAGRPKEVRAESIPIRVTRFMSPPVRSNDAMPAPFPRSAFEVQALSTGDNSSTNIPPDILRSVQLHAIVPSRSSVEADSVSLVLRLRCRLDDETTRDRLRVLGFDVDVVQVEEFHTSPSASYTTRFPLPPDDLQPPNKPLRSHHPVGTLFAVGLLGLPAPNGRIVQERSLVPDGTSKHFKVRGADADLSSVGVPLEGDWLRMAVDVPIWPGLEQCNGRNERTGKRVASQSPFLTVKHEMRVRLAIGYDCPEGDGTTGKKVTLSDELAFVVPLEFVLVTPAAVSPFASPYFPVLAHMHPARAHSTSSLPLPHPPMMSIPTPSPTSSIHAPSRMGSSSSLSSPDDSRPSTPFLPSLNSGFPPQLSLPNTFPPPPLPAYNQLFHANGDRKDNVHVALPLYREKEEGEMHEHEHQDERVHARDHDQDSKHEYGRRDDALSTTSRPTSGSTSSLSSSAAASSPTPSAGSSLDLSSEGSSSSRRTSSWEGRNRHAPLLPRRLQSLTSPPVSPVSSLESPISPGMPLTPPGLGQCGTREQLGLGLELGLGLRTAKSSKDAKTAPNVKGKKRRDDDDKTDVHVFGESFLRFDDEEDSVVERCGDVRDCDPEGMGPHIDGRADEDDDESVVVHYGIAL